MHNALLIAIVAGVGGMLGWGAADFFAKKAVDTVGPIKSLVWAHAFGTVTFLAVALFQGLFWSRTVHLPAESSAWLGLIGFGVLQMIVYWLVYQAFEKGQLAVLNPIFASFSGIVALVSIVFFDEPVTALGLLALVAIFGGVLLMNLDPEGLKSKKLNIVPGLKEIMAATVLAAIWTLGWDHFVNGQDALSYSLWMYVFMSIAAYGLARIMRTKVSGIPKGIWKFLVLMGLCEAVAYLAISWGYSATSLTSVVALISGAFSVPTVILAYVFLHERITKLQTLAVGIIVVGIMLVAIA